MIAFSRGNWGWTVLAVVLLVPLMGFWKWWLGMKARTVDGRTIKSAPLAFSGSINILNSSVPSAPSVAAANQPPSAAQTGQTGASAAKPAAAPAEAVSAPSTAGSADGNHSGYNPKTDRDPTLSPADLERWVLLTSMENSGRLQRHRQARVEDRIELNGIIASETKVNAIINGDRVGVHGVVMGARITRITASCVDFEYKGRTFAKCIGK